MVQYNSMELMICTAAREIEDGSSAVVGTGAPCAVGMLAQKTIAPKMLMLFEEGGIAPLLPVMPVSVGDSRTFYKGIEASSMTETMSLTARGMVDYAFLGGAQIDMYGNLNSSMIGTDYRKPKVRLPGSGGAADLATNCWKVMIVTPHEKRRFVPKVDFITSPGYLTGGNSRYEAGLPERTGPFKIITDLAIMDFEEKTKRMRVISLHPGVTVEKVKENTGFELLVKEDLVTTPEPPEDWLKILREEVDPHKYIIGR